VKVAVEMLAKFSSCYFLCLWKAPRTIVPACKRAWNNALIQSTLFHSRIADAVFVPQRYFVRTEMRLESQIDLHTTELNSSSENQQDCIEHLFQVMMVPGTTLVV